MRRAIDNLLLTKGVIVDLRKTNPDRKVIYPGLHYYINFTDTIINKSVNHRLLNIMHYFICKTLIENNIELNEINKIVIPTESNTIMGLDLAQKMGIDPVIMHHKRRRIFDDQYWDGELPNGSNIIIVHDVIFSGDNILDCKRYLPRNCNIIGAFSLINRLDIDAMHKDAGKKIIEASGIKVYSAIEVNDEYIANFLSSHKNSKRK